jgi:hypothetical protein
LNGRAQSDRCCEAGNDPEETAHDKSARERHGCNAIAAERGCSTSEFVCQRAQVRSPRKSSTAAPVSTRPLFANAICSTASHFELILKSLSRIQSWRRKSPVHFRKPENHV